MAQATSRVPLRELHAKGADAVLDIPTTHTPELIFALCGPIGSPLHTVASELEKKLADSYGYQCHVLRLSKFIDRYAPPPQSPKLLKRYARIDGLISRGNDLRKDHGNSILADLAIREIAQRREKAVQEPAQELEGDDAKGARVVYVPERVCHIIDSIKNADELRALRLVYQDLLYVVGVFAPLEAREKQLERDSVSASEVSLLIDRDSGEEIGYGQTVRQIFPEADYFLRANGDNATELANKVDRLLNLIFDVEVVTPTPGESAMFHAAGAARSSACLSRQVGAAVVDPDGRLVSVGWNDVPRFGGGVYRTDVVNHTTDMRCASGTRQCSNDAEKKDIAKDLVQKLIKNGFGNARDFDKLVDTVLGSKLGDVIEFTRAIHAEMNALLSADRSLIGCTMYCTTYPCHYCAPHIIASGVRAVYYIEPYRKSLALKLHNDAMSEDENHEKRVRILPYDGVAPARFLDLFSMVGDSRKEDGCVKKKPRKEANPRHKVSMESFPILEGLVIRKLKGRLPVEAPTPKER